MDQKRHSLVRGRSSLRNSDGLVERYADAIHEVLNQPRLAPAAMPRLAPPAIAREYLALYTRLLASRRTSPSELAFYADSAAEELDAAEAG